jgi:hypothetical protein
MSEGQREEAEKLQMGMSGISMAPAFHGEKARYMRHVSSRKRAVAQAGFGTALQPKQP